MDPGSTAIATALVTGVGVKALDYLVAVRTKKLDQADTFRSHMLAQVEALWKRQGEVDEELEEWKGRYYTLMEEHIAIKEQHRNLTEEHAQLKASNAQLRFEHGHLQKQYESVVQKLAKLHSQVNGKAREE